MFGYTIFLIVGLILLIKGADLLVKGASALAKKFNVSDLIIGLTVVAFGTSAPELAVNVVASSQAHFDIVFGNIIGSNISNLFLILGFTGILYPLAVQRVTVLKEIPISLFASLLLLILANNFFLARRAAAISLIDSFLLLILLSYFLFYVYRQFKKIKNYNNPSFNHPPALKISLFIIIGLIGLIVGGRMVVNSAIEIASALGVSEKIIGLTIVAVGTSLPELATSVVAAFRKNPGIAVGNIVGSNIFNIAFIIPVITLIRPLTYSTIFNYDLLFLIFGTVLLFILLIIDKRYKLSRWKSATLFIIYIIYVSWLVLIESNIIPLS